MKFPVNGKVVAVVGMTLLLGMVLTRIDFLVAERRGYQEEAVASVQQSHAGAQTLIGPMLQRRCTEQWEISVGEGETRRTEAARRDFELQAPPTRLMAESDSRADIRYRGLFKVNGYMARTVMQAQWAHLTPIEAHREHVGSRLACEPARVWLATSDVRGLRLAQLTVNDAAVDVRPGTGRQETYAKGLHAVMSDSIAPDDGSVARGPLAVGIVVEMVGTTSLALVPAGDETHWTMRSDWPHPSFIGRFLPDRREVGEQGFTAHWALSSLATSAGAELTAGRPLCAPDAGPLSNCLDTLAVAYVDPVNPYSLSDRAIKYGLLFVVLTFVSVALAEALAGRQVRRVHPVQYGFVGLSLCLFFLLLLSLSEHMAFAAAYLWASGCCVALLGIYARFMLGRLRDGLWFGAGMALLYGLLYVLLLREQTALLVGSIGLFAALAAVMLITRRVDWYRLGSVDRDDDGVAVTS